MGFCYIVTPFCKDCANGIALSFLRKRRAERDIRETHSMRQNSPAPHFHKGNQNGQTERRTILLAECSKRWGWGERWGSSFGSSKSLSAHSAITSALLESYSEWEKAFGRAKNVKERSFEIVSRGTTKRCLLGWVNVLFHCFSGCEAGVRGVRAKTAMKRTAYFYNGAL